MGDGKNIADVPFSITLRTAITVSIALITLCSTSVFAVYRLHAKIDGAIETARAAASKVNAVECDVSDIRNWMIYKVPPDGQCRQRLGMAMAAR